MCAKDTDFKATRPELRFFRHLVAPAEDCEKGSSSPHAAACWVYGVAYGVSWISFRAQLLFSTKYKTDRRNALFLHVLDLMYFIESSRTIAKSYLTLQMSHLTSFLSSVTGFLLYSHFYVNH